MAVVVFSKYSSLTPAKYDEVISSLDLDANPPAGLIAHVAGESESGTVSTEIWRTEQTFRAYYDYRLRPALVMHAVEGEPRFEICELHNTFVPEMEMVERMGAVSIPATYSGAAL